MATTLKEQREKKRVEALQEKLMRLDRQLAEERLAEERLVLLLEKMDEDDLKKVSGIIDKLRAVQNIARESGVLSDVIDKALMDLQKVTGGEQSLGQRALALIGRGDNAKIFKNAMGLVSALETGFRLMPQLLKNMLGPVQSGGDQAKKTVADLLVGEGLVREAPGDEDPSIETQPMGDKEAGKLSKGSNKVELLVKNISKAMRPSKWLGLGSGDVPYVGDPDALVTDLLNSVPVGNLMQIVRTVSGGPQASNLAKAIAGPGEGGETQGTEGTEGSAAPTGTAEKGTDTSTPAGEPAAAQRPRTGGVDKENIRAMTHDLARRSGVDASTVGKVMSAMVKDAGLRRAVSQLLAGLGESRSRTLGPDAAMELLKELARSDALADAIEERIVRIQLDESDIRHLIRELERLPPQS